MTSPAELQAAMLAASRELQELIDAHPALVQDEATKERVSSLAEASAFLASSGTVGERNSHVTQACADVRYELHCAKGLRESNKLAIQAAMARLSALQSLAAAVREEYRLGRMGPQEVA